MDSQFPLSQARELSKHQGGAGGKLAPQRDALLRDIRKEDWDLKGDQHGGVNTA